MATKQQNNWVSGKPYDTKPKLSRFEALAEGIRQDQWLSTPVLVEFVRNNFEVFYAPEFMIAALGLRFGDPSLNGYGKKHTGLVKETTIISLSDLPDDEHPTCTLDEVPSEP